MPDDHEQVWRRADGRRIDAKVAALLEPLQATVQIVGWRARKGRMSIINRLFPFFDGHVPVSPYLYIPPKRRWWPFLAAFGAGGACALALFGSQPQSDGAGAKHQPTAYLPTKPNSSVRASSLADALTAPRIPMRADSPPLSTGNAAGSLLTATEAGAESERALPEAAMASVQASITTSATRINTAGTAPRRAKIRGAHWTARPSHVYMRHQVATKSHRHEAPVYTMTRIYDDVGPFLLP